MTNNVDDTDVVVEYGVPVPSGLQNKREALPDLKLGEMKKGASFFLATTNDEHTHRKMRAVRSAILRSSRSRSSFRLFRWLDETTGKSGVRVFCVEDDDETDESV